MKVLMRKICSPLLNVFENGEGKYAYRPSHRKILIIAGLLFFILASFSLFLTLKASLLGGLLPTIFFFIVGLVCEVVGLLGNDTAVARMWKSK